MANAVHNCVLTSSVLFDEHEVACLCAFRLVLLQWGSHEHEDGVLKTDVTCLLELLLSLCFAYSLVSTCQDKRNT